MSNIVKFKSERVVKPKRIKISQFRSSPSFDISPTENLTIQKFLRFVQKDSHHQLNMLKESQIPKEELNKNLFATTFLIEYIDLLLLELTKSLEKK